MKTKRKIGLSMAGVVFTGLVIALLAFSPLVWAQGDPIAKSSKLSVYIIGGNLEIVSDLNESEIISIDIATPEDEVVHMESKDSVLTLSPQPELEDGLYRYDVQVVDTGTGIIKDRLAGDFKIQYGQIVTPPKKEKRAQNFMQGAVQLIGRVFNQVFELLSTDAYAADVYVSESTADVWFDDTDNNTPSWGNYDWVIEAWNATSSSSGLFNIYNLRYSYYYPYLRFEDAGSSGAYSIEVDSSGNLGLANDGMFFSRTSGRLGIGTTAPSYKTDIVGDRIRLRNNSTSTARTIMLRTDGAATDLEAQNAALFIRTDLDGVDNNINLLPGSTANVGINTTSPAQKLHVNGHIRSDGQYIAQYAYPGFWLDETGTGNKGLYYVLDSKSLQIQRRAQNFGAFEATVMHVFIEAPANSFYLSSNGYIGFQRAPSYPLHHLNGAYLSAGGSWMNASSREYKENINPLTSDVAINALKELNPVTYTSKADPEEKHVGFVAEDVPELVATKDRKGLSPMDIVAVLTKVVQEQQKTIAELTEKVQELEKEVKLKGAFASINVK